MANVFKTTGRTVSAGLEAVEEGAFAARDTLKVTRRMINAYGESMALQAEFECEIERLEYEIEHSSRLEELRKKAESVRKAKKS